MLLSFNIWHLLMWCIKHSGRAKLRLQKKTSGENERTELWLDIMVIPTVWWWHHDHRFFHQSILSRPTPKKKRLESKVNLTPKLSVFYLPNTRFLFFSLLILQPCYFLLPIQPVLPSFIWNTSDYKKLKDFKNKKTTTSIFVILYRADKKCSSTWIFIFYYYSKKPKRRFAISSSHQHNKYSKTCKNVWINA